MDGYSKVAPKNKTNHRQFGVTLTNQHFFLQKKKYGPMFYKIIKMVRGLSLVNRCENTVCKRGYDIARILIGYLLSDARYD